MKKLVYFFLLISLLIASNAFSQIQDDPRAFPDSNFSWNESYDEIAYEFNTYFTNRITYYDGGDTIVNNRHYRKLNMIKVYTDLDWMSTWPYSSYVLDIINRHELFGLLRNDKKNKKVYFMYPDSEEELILYDFGLKYKQKVTMNYFPGFDFLDHYVIKVDSVKDPNGISRKYFILSAYLGDTLQSNAEPHPKLVEGIGFSNGIYSQISYQPWEYVFPSLDCINFSENRIYSFGYWLGSSAPFIQNADSCNFTKFKYLVGLENAKTIPIKLYPNPAENFIKFTINGKIDKLEIFDSKLRLVKREENLYAKFIHISELQTGVYFCKIYSNNKLYNAKFIKNK